MKKNILLKTNLAIAAIIIVACMAMLHLNFRTFSEVVEDDIENIAKLTSSTIYAEISNALTKPVFVSLTMANDTFLKNWLVHEQDDIPEHTQDLYDYLTALKNKYKYNSVFLISSASNIYYHIDGVHKTVSRENAHDVWYYRFLDSGLSYKLNVDQDEADHNALTVFVDCRIEDAEGKLLGVVGVGVKMSHLQALLQSYEKDYRLRAFLIDETGLVMADTDTQRIEQSNLFDKPSLVPFREQVFTNRSDQELFWYPEGTTETCVISRYIDTMDWYLVVEKNTKVIEDSFYSLLKQDIGIIAVVLVLVLALISAVIARYNTMMLQMATTDELTGLPTRRSFNERFQKGLIRRGRGGDESESVLFMFDIDNFKGINDRRGHLFGNTVLINVAQSAREILGMDSVLARWGGDEFVGVLWGDLAEVKERLRRLVEETAQGHIQGERLSISLGATIVDASRLTQDGSFDLVLKEADVALYASKAGGKNRLSFFSPECEGAADKDPAAL